MMIAKLWNEDDHKEDGVENIKSYTSDNSKYLLRARAINISNFLPNSKIEKPAILNKNFIKTKIRTV